MEDLLMAIRDRRARRAQLIEELEQIDRELAAIKKELGVSDSTAKGRSRSPKAEGLKRRPPKPGGSVDWAIRALRHGGQMSVEDILKTIRELGGPEIQKATLVSNLSRYVKASDTFTRPKANTFGLIEWEKPVFKEAAMA